jgi:long-subunit acyl-CoA synthetase (AMP-forming)
MPQDTTSAVGIYAKNCLEWNILEYTCYANSMMATPLYDTFGLEAVVNIINETEMAFLFCDDDAKLETLLAHKQEVDATIRQTQSG